MARAGKSRFSLDSLWLYALAAGAVGLTGWLIWRSPILNGASSSVAVPNNASAGPAVAAQQSDLERLMAMSTTQPEPAPARPTAAMVNLTEAGANDAQRGELVIVGKSGVTRVMTKPPAPTDTPSSAARSSALASGTPTSGGKTAKPGPRIYEPDPTKPSDPSHDGQPQYYDYEQAERNRASSGGLPTYYESRDNRPR